MAHELDTRGEVGRFTDAELVCEVKRLVKADRALTARLLVHLAELQERKLYAGLGYSSMFDYCPLLTTDNHVELLDRVVGRTKREIEALVAELEPKPDVRARMRKLPNGRGSMGSSRGAATTASAPEACSTALALTVAGPAVAEPLSAALSSASFALQSPRARASFAPLSPGRFKVELTLGQDGHDDLEQLVELFRHQNPSGDFTSIVERALRELRERVMKQRFGQTHAPVRRAAREHASAKPVSGTGGTGVRVDDSGTMLTLVAAPPCEPAQSGGGSSEVRAPAASGDVAAKSKAISPGSRYVPRRVLGEVYARDAGQCSFVSPDGRRCTALGFLEVHHHDTTYARGGAATVENLRITCRAHNLFLAERDYGRRFMFDCGSGPSAQD